MKDLEIFLNEKSKNNTESAVRYYSVFYKRAVSLFPPNKKPIQFEHGKIHQSGMFHRARIDEVNNDRLNAGDKERILRLFGYDEKKNVKRLYENQKQCSLGRLSKTQTSVFNTNRITLPKHNTYNPLLLRRGFLLC